MFTAITILTIQLRKIEKTIQEMESSDLSPEELKKLEFLRAERASCLKPLKIRITGKTHVPEFPLPDIYSVSTVPNTDESHSNSDSSSDLNEFESINHVAMALHSLKNSIK